METRLAMDFEDVKQEALIALHAAARTFDPQKARFTTYATMLIQQDVFSKLLEIENRKKRTITETSLYDHVKTHKAPTEQRTADPWIKQKIGKFVMALDLPLVKKQAFLLYYFKDKTLKEVGKRFGFTIERARQVIKEVKNILTSDPKMQQLFRENG